MGTGMVASDVIWTDVATDIGPALTRDFLIRYDGQDVPGALWLPIDRRPNALILVGHGGSRHKREVTALKFVAEAVEQACFAGPK